MVEDTRWRRRTPLPPVPALPSRELFRTSTHATSAAPAIPEAPMFATKPCWALAATGLVAVLLVTVRLSTAACVVLPASPACELIAGPLVHCRIVLPLTIAVRVPVGEWFSTRI